MEIKLYVTLRKSEFFPHCTYVVGEILTTNAYYFPQEHYVTSLCRGNRIGFLWGGR
jgi:hypothetical protein